MDEVPSNEDNELLVRWLCDRILRTRTSEIKRILYFSLHRKKNLKFSE